MVEIDEVSTQAAGVLAAELFSLCGKRTDLIEVDVSIRYDVLAARVRSLINSYSISVVLREKTTYHG
jgi:hypothetical protein